MEILRKNQEEMLEIKNTVTGMKNISVRLISRLGMFEERISEPEDYFNKILENQKIKTWRKVPKAVVCELSTRLLVPSNIQESSEVGGSLFLHPFIIPRLSLVFF